MHTASTFSIAQFLNIFNSNSIHIQKYNCYLHMHISSSKCRLSCTNAILLVCFIFQHWSMSHIVTHRMHSFSTACASLIGSCNIACMPPPPTTPLYNFIKYYSTIKMNQMHCFGAACAFLIGTWRKRAEPECGSTLAGSLVETVRSKSVRLRSFDCACLWCSMCILD